MKRKPIAKINTLFVVFLTILVSLQTQAQPLPELMYYKFNAVTGNTISNEGNPSTIISNTGQITGLTVGSAGLTGKALIGNNGATATNNISTPFVMSALGTGDWTIGFWLNNMPANTTLQHIFGDNSITGFRCFKGGAAPINGIMLRGNFTDVPVSTNLTTGPNYIHFVRNATSIKAYVNGVLVNTVNQAAVTITGTSPFFIGGQFTATGMAANMLLDEFRMYNRALSATEIAQTWNTEILPPASNNVMANFVYDANTDTVWMQSEHTFINTSNNASESFWDILSYSSAGISGPYTPWVATRTCDPLSGGCYMETLKKNFTYSFQQAGWYKVMLKINGPGQLTDSVEKTVYVDTPATTPVVDFYSDFTKMGKWGEIKFTELCSNGANQWLWTIDPPCNNCGNPLFFNQFSNANAPRPKLFTNDPGIFKVCLEAANLRGTTKVCKNNYVEVEPGYLMCNGTDIKSTEDSGWVYLYTTDGLYYPSLLGSCSQGFKITACADSIILHINRYRFRNVDTLEVLTGGLNGTVIAKYGGNSFITISNTLKRLSIPGGEVFLKMKINTPLSAPGPNDSGFAIRWTIAPPTFNKPVAGFISPDTVYSGYKINYINASQGNKLTYAWDINGDGIFGTDQPGFFDSTTANPSQIYINTGTQTVIKKIRLITRNCRGVDTFSKDIVILPVAQLPVPDFMVDKTLVFVKDTLRFFDKSSLGANQWEWTFSPNDVTYVLNTNANSQFPVVLLNRAVKYHVTLKATNQAGSALLTKNNYVDARAYFPATSVNPIPVNIDIGISRVVFNDIDTSTDLQTPVYLNLSNIKKTVLYRGASYTLEVFRHTTKDPMTTKAWIDYNRNARFNDADETVLNETAQYKIKCSNAVTIPPSAPIGNCRLRIGVGYGATNLTSDLATTGCFEDYGIEIGTDRIKPVIVLNGPAFLKIEVNKPYVEQHVTATDNIEGNISSRYEMIGGVDITQVGYHTIKYYVKDYYGNVSDTVIRTVQVDINQTGPTLQLIGGDSVMVGAYTSFNDPGATAFDNTGKNISPLVVRTGNLDLSKLGFYSLTYTITDAFGFSKSKTRVVEVKDTIRPVISTINNSSIIIHQLGAAYDDAAYIKVSDTCWKNLIPVRSGLLDIHQRGEYLLTYTVTDGSLNAAIPFTVTVKVKNLIPPVAQLDGSSDMTIDVFSTFSDPGVIKNDNNSATTVAKTDSLNPNRLGTYSITYKVCDIDLNCVVLTRKIHVVDRFAPRIILHGGNLLHHPRFKPFKDPGVTLTDNYYHEEELKPLLRIDTSRLIVHVPDLYVVTYQVSDPSGNVSNEVLRMVQVFEDIHASVNDIKNTDKVVSVYPNPSLDGSIHIRSVHNKLSGITVSNMLGQELYRQTMDIPKVETSIHLSDFKKGIYLVSVTDDTGVNAVVKVVLK